jgi:predicted dehydrogenase
MPVEIRAQCDLGKYHDIEVEDDATLFARYANGATGVFMTTTGEYPGTNRLEIAGTKGKLVIENGRLVLTRLGTDEVTFRGLPEKEKNTCTVEELEDERYNGHQRILENFGRAILYGEPLVSPGEDGLCELTLCNASYLSSWQDRPVSLPMDDGEFYAELQKKIATSRGIRQVAGEHTEAGAYHSRWNTNW